jgi:hypothetical protein
MQILKGGHPLGSPVAMHATGSSYTAIASVKSKNKRYDQLTAKFTAAVGSVQASSTLSFRVTANKRLKS